MSRPKDTHGTSGSPTASGMHSGSSLPPSPPFQYRNLKGYKYQITSTYTYAVPPGYFLVKDDLVTTLDGWVTLHEQGLARLLTCRKGYSWDGPSGPTIDTKNFMRGSLVHDALYQLMREYPNLHTNRDDADRILQFICVEDGMSKSRAALVYLGVHLFGQSSAGIQVKASKPDH